MHACLGFDAFPELEGKSGKRGLLTPPSVFNYKVSERGD